MSFESSNPVERDGDIIPAADAGGLEQAGVVRYQRINETDLDYSDRFAHEVAHAAGRLIEDSQAQGANQDSMLNAAQHEEQRAHAREFIDPMIDQQFEAMLERAKAIPQPHLRESELRRLKALKVARMTEANRRRKA